VCFLLDYSGDRPCAKMFADCSSSYSIFDYLVLGKLPWTLRLVFYGVLVLHWNELLFCLIIDQLWEFSTAFERSLLIYRLVWRVHWNELLFLTFLWLCFSRAEKLGVSSSVSLKWRLSRVDKGWPARIFHWQVYMMTINHSILMKLLYRFSHTAESYSS